MNGISAFNRFTQDLLPSEARMPVLFMGHGSPMNGIEDNEFSQGWSQIAGEIPVPKAVLVISAHWLTDGTHVTAMDFPKTIHDFGGFPRALYEVQYPAPGDPALAQVTADLISQTQVGLDHDWGLDHGAWTVIRHMYPEANIPVVQLSIDYRKNAEYHYSLAKELSKLREKGVLILGSGNMVHNLRMVAWDQLDQPGFGYDWAIQINETFKQLIASRDHEPLIHYERLGREAQLAIPTPDHYFPLIYTLGLHRSDEEAKFFNDKAMGGSLTMTSVQFG
jgi:4,5-DOPA dioxygenase extradiol